MSRLSAVLNYCSTVQIPPSWQQMVAAERLYGIQPDDYMRMWHEQKGVCALCGGIDVDGKTRRTKCLHVDHCHSTGKVRGLLCHKCNHGLGAFKDDSALMRRAAEYIDRSKL